MNNRINLDVKKFTQLKNHFKHSGCFYPNCKEKTIKAHSIQMNGPLKLISDKVEKEGKQVYFLEDELKYIPDEEIIGLHQNEYRKLKNRGISEASTFRGFCDVHDKIFKKIEDVPYSGTKEQQFLFMYRAFAYLIHEKTSGNKGAKAVLGEHNELLNKTSETINGIKEGPNEMFKGLKESLGNVLESIDSTLNDIKDFIPSELTELDASIKFTLDEIIQSGTYEEANYLSRSFDGIFPWVSATVVSYLKEFMILSKDGIAYSNYYSITVLPDKNSSRTHVLIASLNETPNAKSQMEYFKKMRSSDFRKLISNMIIQRSTNVC